MSTKSPSLPQQSAGSTGGREPLLRHCPPPLLFSDKLSKSNLHYE